MECPEFVIKKCGRYVDGSIALITLAIILFYPGKNIKHSFLSIFRYYFFNCCFAFRVSRARILIALLLVAFILFTRY